MADTSQIQQLIIQEAERLGVDPRLALAVARQESNFDPEAVSPKGARGVMQLMPETARTLGVDPTDPRQNIRGGLRYLQQQQRRFGDTRLALAAYNAGPGAVEKYGGVPPYQETQRYVQRILGAAPRQSAPERLDPATLRARLPARPSLAHRFAALFTPAQAEAADAPLAPGQVDWNRELLGTSAPAASQAAPASTPPATTTDWHQELLGTPRPVEEPHGPPPPPSPWGQAVRSAVRTASRGVLGGVPELAVPAVERMTDPTQVPQTAADVGEMLGQAGGSMVLPGPGTAIGGTMGAVTGLTAGTLATEGRLPTWKEVATEAAWSAVPEVLESGVRSVVRTVGRGTRGGRLIRLDEAARRARALPQVYQAQTRQEVGQAFDAVRASGVQLDTSLIQQEVQALRPGKYADLMAEVRRIDQAQKTGQRYQQLVQNLRQPGGGVRVAGWPIGDLQQLRSALRQRGEELTSHEARQLVQDFQRSVDDAIDAGIARGRVPTGMTVDDLQEARRQWARVRAAEDLGDLVERSTDVSPDLTLSSFNLRQLANALRKNTGPLAQRINRSLDQTPGARAAFQREIDDVARLYQTVELPMADVFGLWRAPGFAAMRQGLSHVLASPAGRQIFREAMVNGRGRLSLNSFAAAVNAARRESGLVLPELPGLEALAGPGDTPPATPGGGG